MLSIQPKMNSNTAFTQRMTPEEIEERKYQAARRDLMEQQNDLLDIAENDEIKMPKVAKDIIKGGTVVTTGLLGGMATGWGAKKSIQAFSKIAKTAPVQGLKHQIKATAEFINNSAKTINKQFKASDAYKKPKAKLDKFAQTKAGAPIVKFFKSIGKGISKVFATIKNAVKFVYNKIRGIKKETYEKAAVNFVGASGGVAAGVSTLKEQDEKK